jgi:hypothetical protein
MPWAYKALLLHFGITMGMALILYIIWRLAHRGQKW